MKMIKEVCIFLFLPSYFNRLQLGLKLTTTFALYEIIFYLYKMQELALDEPLLETDVRELVVEAIESLALAQRNAECISLCDEFYPILSVCDAPSEISASSYPDISGNNTKDDFSFNNSQPCLLSQSRDYDSTDEVMTQVFEHQTSSLLSPSCKQRHQMKSGIGDVENTYLTSGCLPNLCKLSRKRIRTASRDHDTSLNAAADEKDVWWSNTLPVRLLVSKTDALLAVQGFAEDTMACLTKYVSSLTSSVAVLYSLLFLCVLALQLYCTVPSLCILALQPYCTVPSLCLLALKPCCTLHHSQLLVLNFQPHIYCSFITQYISQLKIMYVFNTIIICFLHTHCFFNAMLMIY